MKSLFLKTVCAFSMLSASGSLFAQNLDSLETKKGKCPRSIFIKYKNKEHQTERIKAYYLYRDSTSILLQKNCPALEEPMQIAIKDIRLIRFRDGKRRKLGAILGGLAGIAVFSYAVSRSKSTCDNPVSCLDTKANYQTGIWGVSISAVFGGFIGYQIGVKRYKTIKPKKI